jgi:nucleotide-binding universal stress UspA family protein
MQRSMITVMTVLPRQDIGTASADKEMQIQNAAYQKARAQLAALVEELGAVSVPIGINVRSGDTVDAISGCLQDYAADLLVIGARERSALNRFILGSTAYKVLTSIKCPVYVVQERSAARVAQRLRANAHTHAGAALASYVAT